MRKSSAIAVMAGLLMLTACAVTPPPLDIAAPPAPTPPMAGVQPENAPSPLPNAAGLNLRQIDFSQLPGWSDENHAEALDGLIYSCQKLARQKPGKTEFEQHATIAAASPDWATICRTAQNSDSADAKLFFEHFFKPYQILDGEKNTGLITGYYEAALRGSYHRSKKYRYPVYRLPAESQLDLTRADINRGALANKKLELLWVDDPVALLALHIQGSGRVTMDNGRTIRIGFAGKNNHPYFSIGNTFAERRLIPLDKIDMGSIEAWLHANPKLANEVVETNPSYIFFRQIPQLAHQDGPIGAYGIPLLQSRSIAVDRAIYPLGLPLWMDAPHPDSSRPPLQHMVFAHDTGSAIKGVIRADYFFGAGDVAKTNAGLMRARGKIYVLVPKTDFLLSQK